MFWFDWMAAHMQLSSEILSPLQSDDSDEERGADEVGKLEYTEGQLGGGTSTVYQAAFNFVNSIVGAGIVGMPFAFRQAGLAVGVVLMIFVAWLINKSVQMLIATGLKVGHTDFETLGLKVLGKGAFVVTLLSMMTFAFGAMVAYLIVIGDSLPSIIFLASGGVTIVSRTACILISALSIVLPLCLAKDLSSLAWSSLVSISADVLLVFIVVISAPSSAAAQGITFPPQGGYKLSDSGVFLGLGTLSFAFVCQHNSFIVFRSLAQPTQKNWSKVVNMSVGAAFFLCMLFGLSGYLAFGNTSQGDILLSFEPDSKAVAVARAFLAFTMALTYPQVRYCKML